MINFQFEMKNHFILFVIVLAHLPAFSQQHSYKLDWASYSEAPDTEPHYGRLHLLNGFIDFENGEIPTFSCLIKLKELNKNKEIRVTNSSFRTTSLTENEIEKVKNITQIKARVIFKVQQSIAGNHAYASVKIPAVIKRDGKWSKLTSVTFDLEHAPTPTNFKTAKTSKTTSLETGVKMEQNQWFKFSITESGPQKITYNQLKEQGIISGSVSSNLIKIYGNSSTMLPYLSSEKRHPTLQEIRTSIADRNDNSFDPGDYLMFYGEAGDNQQQDSTSQLLVNNSQYYSDTNFVFITLNSGPATRITAVDNSSMVTLKTLDQHDHYFHHEKNSLNFIKSGRVWVGENFQTQNPITFKVASEGIGSLMLDFRACARSTNPANNKISVLVNGDTLTQLNFPTVSAVYYNDYVKFNEKITSFTSASIYNTIQFYFHNQEPAALAWLDYFTLNFKNELYLSKSTPSRLFNKEAIASPGIYEYLFKSDDPSTLLWDITEYNQVKEIKTSHVGTQYSFKANSEQSKDFIVFTETQCKEPTFYRTVPAQELIYDDVPEMIIVTHPLFIKEAQRLADFHSGKDNIKTRVVNAEHIYNHRSSGRKEAVAIRDYIKYLYDHPVGADSLKYVLLFGSGSYDPKNRLDNNLDLIPTYQSENSIKLTSSYVTDDFFGVLDDHEGDFKANDQLDVSVGRLPVKTASEGKVAVDKILGYYNEFSTNQDNGKPYSVKGSWQNNVVFIAEDGDNHEHMKQAEILANFVDTSIQDLNIKKIYVDAFTKEEQISKPTAKNVNRAIKKQFSDGALIVNYTGHGGEFGFGSERFLTIQDILSLNNKTALPLLMTATCEFSRFDDPSLKSAGEYMFSQKSGGAVALFTTVRLVFSIPNFNLNKNFYQVLSEESNNENVRIGDVFRKTKIKNNAGTNDRNFTLLGDPALRLAVPKKTAVLDSIVAWNKTKVDTLNALTQASIYGHIEDKNGSIMNSFDGIIELKIFDKKAERETLNNLNISTSFKYDDQSSMLFRGRAKVEQGKFTAEIIIPKNILSNYGKTKISLFAFSSTEDAKGANKNYTLGGADKNASEDRTGPEISVFINDSSFVFGDPVPPSPYFIAKLSDESGINITSKNIENNLVLTLNKARDTEYVLNEQYQTDLNTFKLGSINYQLKDIKKGSHTLEFRASDNHNNDSKFYTEFIIEEDAELALAHVLNYPNPFTTNTGFYFEQNQIKHSRIEVLIQVYTITGKIVKTIFSNLEADQKLIGPIAWDGKDDFGDRIGRGVYLYKVQVSAENGSKAAHIEKLVILK